MAKLIKCKDCGNEISKKASKCPQCGAPQKHTSFLAKIIAGFFALVLIIGIIASQSESPSTASSSPKQANSAQKVDCSDNAQRQAFIENLITRGYWQKIERPASLLHVYVMPSFVNEATHDDKQQFISVVSAYDICSGGEGLIPVYDAMTNKQIGKFSQDLGLSWK